MPKLIKILLAISIFLVGVSVFYYFVILQSEKVRLLNLEVAQKELDRTEKTFKEKERVKNIDTCISDANNNYIEQWNRMCEYLGKKPHCALYEQAERLDKVQKDSIEMCYKTYPPI